MRWDPFSITVTARGARKDTEGVVAMTTTLRPPAKCQLTLATGGTTLHGHGRTHIAGTAGGLPVTSPSRRTAR